MIIAHKIRPKIINIYMSLYDIGEFQLPSFSVPIFKLHNCFKIMWCVYARSVFTISTT